MHVRRGIGITVLVLTATAAACGGGNGDGDDAGRGEPAGDTAAPRVTGTVTVFAAASLTGAFTEAEEAFERAHPGVDVVTNFAASSALATQIAEGAPADVFASADQTSLTGSDRAAGEPVTFATNVLEIVVEQGNPLGITGLADLADPDLIVTICAPEVPCGRYAAAIFANAGVEPAPDSFEENVKAVVTKVTTGEADAGLAYATDIRAVDDRADGVAIPTEQNLIAEYPIVLTAEAPNPAGGHAWIDFITSADGRAILAAHGFGVP